MREINFHVSPCYDWRLLYLVSSLSSPSSSFQLKRLARDIQLISFSLPLVCERDRCMAKVCQSRMSTDGERKQRAMYNVARLCT